MSVTAPSFPPFSLTRLLSTVFQPKGGERVAILIDLPDPAQVKDFAFLKDPALTIQRHAYNVFFQGLQQGGLKELGLKGGERRCIAASLGCPLAADLDGTFLRG